MKWHFTATFLFMASNRSLGWVSATWWETQSGKLSATWWETVGGEAVGGLVGDAFTVISFIPISNWSPSLSGSWARCRLLIMVCV